MSFLNSIVDKVYVINLERDTKKMTSVSKEFENQNINFERFNAIDGKLIGDDNRFTNICNKYCPVGAKGCALSHRTIWENALKNNYESIAVFEDDILFDKNFSNTLQLNYNNIPKDFDVIFLGSSFQCGDTSLYNRFLETVLNINNTRINENILKVSGCCGIYAYIISKKCMEQFVKEKIEFHIDQDMIKHIRKHNLKSYAFQPVIVETSIEDSNLTSKFPPLLNYSLSQIKLTNQKNPITLDWALSETSYQINKLKISYLIGIIFLICFLIPLKYYYVLFLWLTIEFILSFDLTNTLIYGIILSIPFFVRNY